MKITKFISALCAFALLASASPWAQSSQQAMVHRGDGSLDLKNIDLCLSRDGRDFARKNGGLCHAGDLAYIGVAFDENQAGDLAEKMCDFDKGLPDESMDVRGVLCFLRVDPA